MDKPKTYKWTDVHTQKAVLADRVAGLTVAEIGEKYGIHQNTVSRICNKFIKEHPESELAKGIVDGWRDRMAVKAVQAVEGALDDDTDSYKAGNLGATVLRGLGHLEPDQKSQIAIMWANAPQDLRDELREIQEGRREIGYFPRERSDFANDEEYRKWEDRNPVRTDEK
jgi:hypothetical protein